MMKRICSILILIVILLNSSVITLLGMTVDAISEVIASEESNMQTVQNLTLEKYINYDGESEKGTMIQLGLSVGLQNEEDKETFIKSSTIKMECPKILDKEPKRIEVIGFDSDYKDGVITISKTYEKELKYENLTEYTLLLFYDEECYTEENTERVLESKVSVEYVLSDGIKVTGETNPEESITVTENVGTIISTKYETDEIYNGYIKNNISNGTAYDTKYNETTKIVISNKNIASKYTLTANNVFVINDKEIQTNHNLLFNNIKFEKTKIERVLGNDGQIRLLDENGEELYSIKSSKESDEDGNYIYTFEQPVENIKLEISNVEKEGIIEYTTSKVIKSTLTQDIEKIKNIIHIEGTVEKEVEVFNEEENKNENVKQQEVVYTADLDKEIAIKNAKPQMSMDISNTKLTNNAQNEVTITAVLKKDSPDCKLFENPILVITLPEEVEKVIVKDSSLLYDKELTKGEVITGKSTTSDNQIIKMTLSGKQTQYQSEDISEGTTVVISAILILKQDITTKDSTIKMKCAGAACEQTVRLIEKNEVVEKPEEEKPGKIENVEGLKIETKALLGDSILYNHATIYEQEIIKYEVKVTNTSDETIENVKVLGKIAEGTTYVKLVEGTFYDEKYDFVPDADVKEKEIILGTIKSGETISSYYEVKVDDLKSSEKEKETNTEIKVFVGDAEAYKTTLTNVIKQAEMAVEVKGYVSRAERNQWYYYTHVKNISSQDKKKVSVTIPLSKNLQIQEVNVFGQEDANIEKIIENNCITIKFSSFKASNNNEIETHETGFDSGENEAVIHIIANIINIDESEDYSWKISTVATVKTENDNIYKSNENRASGYIEAVKITQSSDKAGEKIKVGEEVTYIYKVENVGNVLEEFGKYTAVNFKSYIPNELEVLSLEYNTNILHFKTEDSKIKVSLTPENVVADEFELTKINGKDNTSDARISLDLNIKVGETATIVIKAKARMTYVNSDVENYATVTGENIETKQSNVIKNEIENSDVIIKDEDDKDTKPTDPSNPDNPNNPNNPNNPDNPSNPGNQNPGNIIIKKYSISGCVWLDDNENGQRDDDENKKSGIEVLLLDVDKNEFVKDSKGNVITKVTDSKGQYKFENIQQGNYYVIFKYDSENYEVTTYKKSGISITLNSDAVKKEAEIGGKTVVIAMTDSIELKDDKTNIDLGLIENKVFDLKLEQYVQKITVQNSKGTKEYNYNNAKFAKVEIPSKQIVGSTLVVEYKIVITNIGELAGTVNEIVDNMPATMKFNSELNSSWYRTMNYNLSNTSLVNKEIKPGESVEVSLILTRTLDESVQTYTNIAQIGISDNIKHIPDQNGNNDIDTVEIVVSISTGSPVTYIGTVIGSVICILIMLFVVLLISKKVRRGKIAKTFFVLLLALMILPGMKGYSDAAASEIVSIKMRSLNEKVFTDGTYLYQCQSTGLHQCSQHGHTYKLVKTTILSENKTYEGDLTNNLTLNKVETEINYKKMGDLKVYGPFRVTCESTKTPTYSIRVDGILESDPTNVKLNVSYKLMNEDATEEVTLGPDKDFYIVVPEDVYGLTYVQVKASATASRSYSLKKTIQYDYECISIENGDTNCEAPEKVQKMSRTEEIAEEGTENNEVIKTVDWKPEELPKLIKVVKTDYDDNTPLEGVQFIIKNKDFGYVKQDSISKIVEYVKDEKDATTFITDKDGVILVEGLIKGEYTLHEIYNPYHGYNNTKNINGNRKVVIKDSQTIVIYEAKNRKLFGEITIEKVNDKDSNIKLQGVQFVIQSADGLKYLQVATRENDLNVGTVLVGNVIVTSQEFTTDISKATIFETNEKGQISIKNIELSSVDDDIDNDNTNKLIVKEIKNPNYGYEVDSQYITWVVNGKDVAGSSDNISFDTTNSVGDTSSNEKTLIVVKNEQKYVKISGYVWEDIADNKDNTRNNLYDSDVQSKDKLVEGIKVTLHDTLTGKTYVTFTDKNGKYSFGSKKQDGTYSEDNLLVRNLDKYYIEFEYNGMKYTNVVSLVEQVNGSKATEGETRTNFNDKFAYMNQVKDYVLPNDGTSTNIANDISGKNQTIINYIKSGDYQSKVTYTEGRNDINEYYAVDKYHISATTEKNGYNLSKAYVAGKDEITNINLGIYNREQIDLAISSDIERAEVTLKGYTHTYKYGAKEAYGKEAFNVGVKFGDKYTTRYTRTIYQSAIAWANTDKDANKLGVYITYKIAVQNQSTNLQAQVNELVNYYDKEYTIQDIYCMNGDSKITLNNANCRVDGNTLPNGFKTVYIRVPEKIVAGKSIDVFITFKVSDEAVLGLLNKECTLENMSEITSYSTFDESGNRYASIDEDSVPGTSKLELDSNNRLIKTTYEDDTDMAPSMILQADKQTVISGTLFEDNAIASILKDRNERLGNGIYDENENILYNVKVELIEVDQNGKIVYEDGKAKVSKLYKFTENQPSASNNSTVKDAVTYTDEKGNYKFEGVVPNKYLVRYTYGEKTYILQKGQSYSDGMKEISVRDYKSTSVTSNVIRNALNVDGHTGKVTGTGDYNWYIVKEKDQNGNVIRYSDAVDNIEERIKLEQISVNYSSLQTNTAGKNMTANTPVFNVGVEFTSIISYRSESDEYELDQNGKPILNENGLPKLNPNFVSEEKYMDFGIILRPKVNITIDKSISHLSIQLANGQILMDGDPRSDTMPYTRTGLDDIVFIEIDSELIQGATLKMSYDLALTNKSEIDYEFASDSSIAGKRYYYFGEKVEGLQKANARAEIVGDYLDAELLYDKEKMNGWTQITIDELFEKGLVSEEVRDALKAGKYNVYITNAFDEGIESGNTKTVTLNVTKLLSSKGDINLSNDVEILQLSGGATRTSYSTTPGNLIPENPKEIDEDSVALVVLTPTGGVDYIIYISILASSLVIIIVGAIFIKRRVLK